MSVFHLESDPAGGANWSISTTDRWEAGTTGPPRYLRDTAAETLLVGQAFTGHKAAATLRGERTAGCARQPALGGGWVAWRGHGSAASAALDSRSRCCYDIAYITDTW